MKDTNWQRFKALTVNEIEQGLLVDFSSMNIDLNLIRELDGKMQEVFDAMEALEQGSIANPDEGRMVGHYWLRNPELAPCTEIRSEINSTLSEIKSFTEAVHDGRIAPEAGGRFCHLLLIGIGGSALGPQFVNQALSSPSDPLDIYFIDNTDPDGIVRTLSGIPDLSCTLCIVISKSGGTKETRNGQLAVKSFMQQRGIAYNKHFVAVTCEGSALDRQAKEERWLARFPMWDWVGGRTSQLSAVGLLPAALQGFDIDALLAGAKVMDEIDRRRDLLANPAAMMALSWHTAGSGRGDKNMVVLPYKDRLELLGRYLQQLIMESIGKERALDGRQVMQGLTVYGNKGSTDQHAFVQQLREGRNDFFAVMIEVLEDRPLLASRNAAVDGECVVGLEVEPGITSGDFLFGFLLGTRQALAENGRESLTITINEVSARSVGMLIALFERAVGFYAAFVGVNAYHQPGVEAGKKAAGAVLVRQMEVLKYLRNHRTSVTVEELAEAIAAPDEKVLLFKILQHLCATGRVNRIPAEGIFEARYHVEE